MNKIVKEAIGESWGEYCAHTPSFFINAKESHKHGWKDGYEWILTELKISGKISEETFKEYMKKI